MIVLAVILILSLISANPEITSAEVYPVKVRPGDVMLVTVMVKGSVASVEAEMSHELGSDRINLQKLSKRINNSDVYEGSWVVHDTKGETAYMTYVTIKGIFGRTASAEIEWLDPTVAHRASETTGGGSFGSGNYTFPEDLTINGTITLEKQNSTPTNSTGYGKLYYTTDHYTKLLLHMDGTNGTNASSATDSSASAHTISGSYGQAHLSTDQYKFGTAALRLDGTGDYLSLADSDDWDFGTGNFTIDLWVYTSDWTQEYKAFINYGKENDRAFMIATYTSGKIYAQNKGQGINFIVTHGWSINTWHHVAFVRNGNTYNLYFDGTSVADGIDATNLHDDTYDTFWIGRQLSDAARYFQGQIDELRISKGIARWTSNFSVPNLPHYIKGLVFLDEEGIEHRID